MADTQVAALFAAANAAANEEADAHRQAITRAIAHEMFNQGSQPVATALANRLMQVMEGEYQINGVHALIAILAHFAASKAEPYHVAGAYAHLLGAATDWAIARNRERKP